MSTASHDTRPVPLWADRISDRLNPILVKETRQALKSRQFIATFMLMLVAAWLISVFGMAFAGPGVEHKPIGGTFFFAYFVVLAVAVFIAVPFGAFRSLLSERDLQTYEVLSITTLKPRQIVWGKLLSSLVQVFIYYSAITPFIAFANLLKGIDVPTIAFTLVAAMLWSLLLSMIALTLSTLANQRYWQVLLTLAVLGALLFAFFMSLSAAGAGLEMGFGFDEPEFWWGVGVAVAYGLSYCWLFLKVSISQLTFDADNRSSGIRIAASFIFWMTFGWVFLMLTLGGAWGLPSPSARDVNGILRVASVPMAVHMTVIGLFAVTEPDVLSRRVRRNLERFGMARRLIAPFLPGGARGYLFVGVHLAGLVLSALAAFALFGPGPVEISTLSFITGICCYIMIYLGLGSFLGRAARAVSGDFRPAHARVLIVLLAACGAILPQTLYFFDIRSWNLSRIYFVTDPFSTLYHLSEGHAESSLLVLVLAAVALLAMALNLRAVLVGIADAGRTLESRPAPAATSNS